ncbi:MAG: carboxypeptidase regulatory-like domain-containing protein [Candidatus Bathyarchaeota archaeon]|nr:carboxypeptidase regulatory-like domain-containing protein [Candidatus Bathyarchaeota archaeon]
MERRTLYAIIIVIIVIGAIAAFLYTSPGKEPGPPPPPPPPITLANITGTITAEDTGLPIEGAKVTLVGAAMSYTTASDGVYSFSKEFIDPINYTLTTEKKGYETKTLKVFAIEAKQYTLNFVLKLSGTSIYLEPSEIVLNTGEVSVGHRFNVTAWVSNVADLMGFQVALYYNASVINMTSASLHADHVLAGQLGIPLKRYEYFEPWGVGFIGFGAFYGATPFTGTGKLAVFEFEIIAAPPGGGSLTSDLIISYKPGEGVYETKLKDSAGVPMAFTGTDGSYEYESVA